MSDRLKILVADDDIMILRLVSDSLIKRDHEVITAIDGDEALEKALNNDIDVLITDIVMPGMEGIEVISEVAHKKPDVGIIAISSEGSAGYTSFLEMAKTVGAGASLKKPFKRRDLIIALHSVM